MIAYILIILVLVGIPTAYGQLYSPSTTEPTTLEAIKHLNKITTVTEMCINKARAGDTAIIETCLGIIKQFNTHMSQLWNETRADLTKILLD